MKKTYVLSYKLVRTYEGEDMTENEARQKFVKELAYCNDIVEYVKPANKYQSDKKPLNAFDRNIENEREYISITWCIEDVKQIREDLTDEQAFHVLEEVLDLHDADWGVNWESLRTAAELLYPKRSEDDDEEAQDDASEDNALLF